VKEPFGSNSQGEDIRFAGTVLELEVELVLNKVSSFSFMLLNQSFCLWQKVSPLLTP
jgi:hypothetical protein